MKNIFRPMLLLMLSMGIDIPLQAQDWEVIATPADLGAFYLPNTANRPVIRTDAGGLHYIAYRDLDLGGAVRVRRRTGTTWEQLGDNVGIGFEDIQNTHRTVFDMAISGTDVFIAYVDDNQVPYVKHYNTNTGLWYTLGGGPVSGAELVNHVSIDAASDGTLHVAVSFPNSPSPGALPRTSVHRFNMTSWDGYAYGGSWEQLGVELGAGVPVVRAGSDSLYVASASVNVMRVHSYDKYTGQWINLPLPAPTLIADYARLEVFQDQPYIADGGNVKKFTGTEWESIGNVDDWFSSARPDLLVSPTGNVFLAAPRGISNKLAVYKFRDNGTWFMLGNEEITSVQAGSPALAMTPSGNLAVYYPHVVSMEPWVQEFTGANSCIPAAPAVFEPRFICDNQSTVLYSTDLGHLNDCSTWFLSDGSCDNTPVTGTTFSLSPDWSTNYYLKADAACGESEVICSELMVNVTPSVPEICNGLDDDCDGLIDEGLVINDYYYDNDNDGYGTADNVLQSCAAPIGYVSVAGDCDDTNGAVNPGAAEIPENGIDDNCNGLIDEVTWTGAVSSNTMDGANWSSGVEPDNTTSIIVSASATNALVIDAPGFVFAGVAIEPGATLIVTPEGELTIFGLLVNDGLIQMTSGGYGLGSLITYGGITGEGTHIMDQPLTGSGGTVPDGRFWYVSSPMAETYSFVYDALGPNKLWSANESTTSYTEITDNSTLLNPMEGYVLRAAASQDFSFSAFGAGGFNTGDMTLNGLTRTGTINPNRGYHLVGNPYPSSIDWSMAGRTNLDPTVWFRTHDGSTMLYDAYNALAGLGTDNTGFGEVTGFIPPTQGFWVRVSDDGEEGTLQFTDAMRLHSSTWNDNIYKLAAGPDRLTLTLSDGVRKDQHIISFSPDAADGLEDHDSHKLFASAIIPQLYSWIGTDTLVINSFSASGTTSSVDLGMKLPVSGEYTITATSLELSTPAVLEDRLLNVFHDLTVQPVYSFTSTGGNVASRFTVHFNALVTDLSQAEGVTNIYQGQNGIHVSLDGNSMFPCTIQVLDMAGRSILVQQIVTEQTVIPTSLPEGVYLVRILGPDRTSVVKLAIRK